VGRQIAVGDVRGVLHVLAEHGLQQDVAHHHDGQARIAELAKRRRGEAFGQSGLGIHGSGASLGDAEDKVDDKGGASAMPKGKGILEARRMPTLATIGMKRGTA
jgi:hypothetical protein